MFNPSIIVPRSECGKRIAALKKTGSNFVAEVHLIGISVLTHIKDHGDYTLAISLLDAMPSGVRVKQLADWFRHFSNDVATFTYKPSEGWTCKLAKKRSEADFDIEGAYGTTFGDLAPEKMPSTMTVPSLLSYLKRTSNNDKLNSDGTPKVALAVREITAGWYAQLMKSLNAATPAA
jgi:hypothetical protein